MGQVGAAWYTRRVPSATANNPWSKHIPDGPWDYIVIGSGMGGMTTAALLAKLGRRVLVLEQHYVPGGYTHTFRRPGYRWDVGVHAVGEVTEHSLPGRLLAALTDGQLEWASLGAHYEEFHFPGGFRIDFPDSPAEFRETLREAFPNEHEAIDGYFHLVRAVGKAMQPHYLSRLVPQAVSRLTDRLVGRAAKRYMAMTTAAVVGELTQDERLRAVLTAQWGYYGSPPSSSAFAIQALVAKHFMWGGYYPVGGSAQIARTLLGTVARGGGWTAIRADVKQIRIEDRRAVGVELADGREIRAPRVVSAVGLRSTLERLVPASPIKSRWTDDTRELMPAPAHVCLYLGFEGDIRAAGASGANKWFYETWDSEAAAWAVRSDLNTLPDAPVLYCSFPSLKDPTHDPGPANRHTGEVVTFVPFDAFADFADGRPGRRGPEYEAFKERIKGHMLGQLFGHMPGLEPHLRHAELSTPVSTQHFVRPARGSIYGLESTPARFQNRWLRARSPIPGLFMSGCDVGAAGVIGAMMGGVLAAASAEPLAASKFVGPLLRRRPGGPARSASEGQ